MTRATIARWGLDRGAGGGADSSSDDAGTTGQGVVKPSLTIGAEEKLR